MALTWSETKRFRIRGSHSGPLTMIQGVLTITSPAVGSSADEIPASTFGLAQIYGCGGIISDVGNEIWLGSPDETKNSLIIRDPVDPDQTNDLPVGVYNIMIWGTVTTT